MAAESFIDSGIIIHAYDTDAGRKREIAKAILLGGWQHPGTVAISVQVLLEFFVTATRRGIESTTVHQIITDLSRWPVIDNTVERFGHGLAIRQRWQVSLWDSMILSAAHASGATKLITEDLNHGEDYGGVRAVNPFHDSNCDRS